MKMTCKQCESKYTGNTREEIEGYVSRRCTKSDCKLKAPSNLKEQIMSASVKWIENMRSQVKSKKERRKEAAALLRTKMQEKVVETPEEDSMYIEFEAPIEQHVYV